LKAERLVSYGIAMSDQQAIGLARIRKDREELRHLLQHGNESRPIIVQQPTAPQLLQGDRLPQPDEVLMLPQQGLDVQRLLPSAQHLQ